MPNTHGEKPNYKENRYGFHSTLGAERERETAGVSPEFIHVEVVDKISGLLVKAQKALQLKRDDPEYQAAVAVLSACISSVVAPLENQAVNVDKTEEPQPDFSKSPKF